MKDLEQLYRKFGRTFPAGTVLFEENQECNAAYIICKGKVRIYKKAAAKEIDIDLLGEGEFFGEMACLMGQPRSINASTAEDCELLIVEPDLLESLFRDKSGIGLKIIGKLAHRLRKAYGIIEELIEEREKSGNPGKKI
jgi:CRP/FNR family cyclic AMP-dependent transcriptional regulator